jgi:Leucine-rich repeat (LRR) protein
MIIETKEGFKILVTAAGHKQFFMDSDRISDSIKFLRKHNLRCVAINSFQGYKSNEIDFLKQLTDFLEGIIIPESKYNIGIVNNLHNLRYLGFVNNHSDIIDLSNFPKLETLACDYSEQLARLDTCNHLQSLTLSNYDSKENNLLALPKLSELLHLSLIHTKIASLKGIGKFAKLKKLEIYGAMNLDNIEEMEKLSDTLEILEIERSKKVKDYTVIKELIKLERIRISECGRIETLSFIKYLRNLKFLSFVGTNILDGNLSYCKGLSYVGFDDKKHYSHKMVEFKKLQ